MLRLALGLVLGAIAACGGLVALDGPDRAPDAGVGEAGAPSPDAWSWPDAEPPPALTRPPPVPRPLRVR